MRRSLVPILCLAASACGATVTDTEVRVGLSRISGGDIVYLDRNRSHAYTFGSNLGVGRIDFGEENPISLQEWSEPIENCSDEQFNCLRSGSLALISPKGARVAGQEYRHRGYIVRVLECEADQGICLMEVRRDPSGNAPPTLPAYFRQGPNGVLSLGISEVPKALPGARQESRRFTLASSTALFGP